MHPTSVLFSDHAVLLFWNTNMAVMTSPVCIRSLELTQVKTKFDTNTSSSKSKHSELLRCEIIWIQCFHWPNITKCGKYPSTTAISSVTRCSANGNIRAAAPKRKNLGLCLCLRQGRRFHGNKNCCTCACAWVASENQA